MPADIMHETITSSFGSSAHAATLATNIVDCFKSGHFADVLITAGVGTENGKPLLVHSQVLAALSSVIYQNLHEIAPVDGSVSQQNHATVVLADFDPSTVQRFVHFIYTGVSYGSEQQCSNLLELLSLLGIEIGGVKNSLQSEASNVVSTPSLDATVTVAAATPISCTIDNGGVRAVTLFDGVDGFSPSNHTNPVVSPALHVGGVIKRERVDHALHNGQLDPLDSTNFDQHLNQFFSHTTAAATVAAASANVAAASVIVGHHTCDVCGVSFATTSLLKRHRKTEHRSSRRSIRSGIGGNVVVGRGGRRSSKLKCTVCRVEFTKESALSRHMKTAHGGDDDDEDLPLAARKAAAPPKQENDTRANNGAMNHDADGEDDVDNDADDDGASAAGDDDGAETLSQILDKVDHAIIKNNKRNTRQRRTTTNSTSRNERPKRGPYKKKNAPPFECKECGKHYSTAFVLKEHMSLHTGEKFECNICHKMIRKRDSYMAHLRLHTGERPYACEFCPKRFNAPYGLKIHRRRHTGDSPYSCDLCHKVFLCAQNLRQHESVHTGVKGFQCDKCEKSYSQKSALRLHLKVHTGERPHQCEVCSLTFRERFHLTRHLKRAHSDEKLERRYQCEICSKTFYWQWSLTCHRYIHSGVKRFLCNVCGKNFLTKTGLFGHRQIHGGVKKHGCTLCEKRFFTTTKLRKHVESIHMGANRPKPFKCQECPRAFPDRGHLREHFRTHTGEKPFLCSVCSMSFFTRSDMRKHQIKQHNQIDLTYDDQTSFSTGNHSTSASITPATDII